MNNISVIYFTCIFLIFSCSTMSKNMIVSGESYFRGGVSSDRTWDSDLIFKRKSWYRDLTLAYDVLIAPVDKSSDFFTWFSKDMKKVVTSCPDFKLYLVYSWDTQRVNYQEIIQSVKKQGFEDYALNDFKLHLDMHPAYYPRGFHPYKLWGLCGKNKGQKIVISIPGYKKVTFN